MAEYYGKLKDSSEGSGGRKFRKIISLIFLGLFIVFIVSALVGIFGDTKRRDKTREIVTENSELKQQVGDMAVEIEKLEEENAQLRKTLEKNFIEAGTTLSKPEGDMSEEDAETEEAAADTEDEEE